MECFTWNGTLPRAFFDTFPMSSLPSHRHVGRSRAMTGCSSEPLPCCDGSSVYIRLRRFPFSVDWSVGDKRRRAGYMGVPPLFSFLGGSGSGTASGACIGLFVGIITLAGIGEAECDMTLYMASDGFWDCPICIRTQDSMTLSIVCECNQ